MEANHALVITFPVQGTFNAVFDFAKVLSARGFIVTFVNSEHMHRRLFESPKHEQEAVEWLRREGLHIRFKCIPDGLPPEFDRASNLAQVGRALQGWGPALETLAATLEEEGTPVTCVVGNFSVYSSARSLALKLGVPRIIFWPFCVGASVAHCHTRLLISEGYLPYEGNDALITCLPRGMPPVLRTSDLTLSHLDDQFFQFFVYESDFHADADCVVVNSFEELEGPDILRGLSVNCPALTIGPVFLHQKTETDIRASMWKEDAGCMRWLDGQAPGSVLYVSFGSIAALPIGQLHELALGLEASQQPFLWSLRFVGKSLDDVLPRGFAERTRDRGLMVEWAPQRHVLAHPSVGGFLTHCGWNSTLESISLGVPMIGWPLLFDQFINCRFATEVWKVAVSSNHISDGKEVVTKEEVENLVRGLMWGEEGKMVRENAKRAGEAAAKSVMAEGSSSKNIDVLVELIDAKLRQRQKK